MLERAAQRRLEADPELRARAAVAQRTSTPTFRGSALTIQALTAREWMLAGPSETGKTWATVWRLDQLLATTPKAQGVLLRKVRVTISGTVLLTYLKVIARSGSGARPFGGNNPVWFDYPNGARLWIGGMDDPGKVLSGERDFIYVNQAEELAQDDWEVLTTRATGRGAVTATPMLFGDCNPGPADHWIKKRQAAGSLRFFESRHEDNPSLFEDDGTMTGQGRLTIATLDALTGVRKLRLRKGLWVGAEGQYFEGWDEELHTCAPFPIPEDWPVWGALDYGYAHNTAFHLFTRHEGVRYVIGEHVRHKWLVPQHCRAIRDLLDRIGIAPWRLTQIVAGHDVFYQRGASDGKTIADQFAEAVDPLTGESIGLSLEHANLDRINGAAHIQESLGNAELHIPPTVKVFTTCPRLIATIPAMVHDPRKPEDVLKVDADANGDGGDDAYDDFRYGLMVAEGVPFRPATAGQRTSLAPPMRRGLR